MITKLMTIFLVTAFTASAIATETCAVCGNKDIQGMPKIDSKLMNVLEANIPKPTRKVTDPFDPRPVVVYPEKVSNVPFESNLQSYCLGFIQTTENSMPLLIKKIETKTAYSIDDYLTYPWCEQKGYNSNFVRSPILHQVADEPNGKENYLQVFWEHYHYDKPNGDALWLKVINAKNTKGETLLDYIEGETSRGSYPNSDATGAINTIIAYACSHGATYAKYDKKCP